MSEELSLSTWRRLVVIWITGSATTGLLCALGVALAHSAWVTPVLGLLGASTLTVMFVRAWWRDGRRAHAQATLTRLEVMLGLALSAILLGVFSVPLLLGSATAQPGSLYLPDTRWDQLLTLALDGGIATCLFTPLLCTAGMAVMLLWPRQRKNTAQRPIP
jgi:hypothetical protein